jgi:SrtB family sortase
MATNKETIGWITVPGTKCDNPVVKTKDNEKYLDTTFEGKKSKYGTIYADMACKIEKPIHADVDPATAMSDNIILYGHHMRDGTMFGELKNYRKYDFYKKNPVIQFTTLYDTKTVDYKIVSMFIVNTKKYDSTDSVFNYRVVDFSNEYQFMAYMNEVQQRSIINTGVDVQYGDKLLTLSTCTYEFDDARFVVVARRVREGENSQVDLSKTSKNNDVVYPKAYYKGTGTSGRTEVTSLVFTPSTPVNSQVQSSVSSESESSTPSVSSTTPSWSGNQSSGGGDTTSSQSASSQETPSSSVPPAAATPTDS